MHRVVGRRHPGDLGVLAAPAGALQRPAQALIAEPQPHPADRPAHRELPGHRPDHAGDSLIGVESDLSVGFAPDQPGRQPATQVAAGGLAADPAVQAGPQHLKFSLLCGLLRYADHKPSGCCELGRRCRRVGIIPAQRWLAVSFLPGWRLILLSGRDGRPEEEFMMAKTKPSWAEVTGPLAEYADGFRAELFRLGYTPLAAAVQLRLTAHLSRWMTAECLGAQDLDMPAAERYFAARRSAGYANERTIEALGPLLGYLRGLGVIPLPPEEPVTETSRLLDRFAAYLVSERGLAPRTVALNVRLARPFLQQRAAVRDGHLDLNQLTAGEVRAFV